MIITVIGAIWGISSTGVRNESVLFTRDNALFWGLSFGFGYAATISMLAATISATGSQASLSVAMGLGHAVTAATLVWIHIRRLESFADGHTSEAGVEDENEEPEGDENEPGSDDWDEAGWKSPDDVVDDSTSSIQGADVDWENDDEDDSDESEGNDDEDDSDGDEEDDDDEEIELVDLD